LWESVLQLRRRDTDYLGHVTATVHLELFEEARAAWMAEITDDPTPAFVVARQEIDYRRELLVDQGPVTVAVKPLEVSTSSATVRETLKSATGLLHTESRAVLVRWDRERRRSMPFHSFERERIRIQLAG
jgi:acyl-CoA thioesterase FadM